MNISIKYEIQDWHRYQDHLEKTLPKTVKSWSDSFWFNLVIWAVLAFFFMSVFQSTATFHWPTAGLVSGFFVLVFILFVVHLIKAKNAFAPSAAGVFVGEHRFAFDDDGIISEGKGHHCQHHWSLVRRIERANGMILIFLDTALAFIFPEHKLENPDQFYNYINDHYKKP